MDIIQEDEISRVFPKLGAIRIGSLGNLPMAIEIVNRTAARIPGEYFIVDTATNDVAGWIRTSIEDAAISVLDSAASPRFEREESVTEHEPGFAIFTGAPDKNALWIESIEGLSDARERMEQLGADKPGEYFVFSNRDHSILARINTTVQKQSVREMIAEKRRCLGA